MNTEIIESLFPEAIIRIKNKKCPICNGKIDESKFNEISLKEFKISGLCQSCQDKTFGVD